MIELDLFFQYRKGRCRGNQFCEKMAPMFTMRRHHYAMLWSVIGCFHKYSLWGDTTAVSGLYARLCHGFLVFIDFSGRSMRQVISESTVATDLHQIVGLVDVWEGLITRSFILRSLKRRCHNSQFLGPFLPISFGRLPPSFDALAFRNWLHDRNSDFRRLNGNKFSSLYIVYNFGATQSN